MFSALLLQWLIKSRVLMAVSLVSLQQTYGAEFVWNIKSRYRIVIHIGLAPKYRDNVVWWGPWKFPALMHNHVHTETHTQRVLVFPRSSADTDTHMPLHLTKVWCQHSFGVQAINVFDYMFQCCAIVSSFPYSVSSSPHRSHVDYVLLLFRLFFLNSATPFILILYVVSLKYCICRQPVKYQDIKELSV